MAFKSEKIGLILFTFTPGVAANRFSYNGSSIFWIVAIILIFVKLALYLCYCVVKRQREQDFLEAQLNIAQHTETNDDYSRVQQGVCNVGCEDERPVYFVYSASVISQDVQTQPFPDQPPSYYSLFADVNRQPNNAGIATH